MKWIRGAVLSASASLHQLHRIIGIMVYRIMCIIVYWNNCINSEIIRIFELIYQEKIGIIDYKIIEIIGLVARID
jgi:hypothetical protein